jgi:hypothetical protein
MSYIHRWVLQDGPHRPEKDGEQVRLRAEVAATKVCDMQDAIDWANDYSK